MTELKKVDVESELSLSSSGSELDISFAFNDNIFSDRILRIEILPDLPESKTSGDSCTSIADLACNRKRRREDIKEKTGDETAQRGDSSLSLSVTFPTVIKVETLHISSAILAVKSPFFYKLFKSGKHQYETLMIHASEEVALMELLNFMYSNTLSITTRPDLLDVLMAADKYEVASCMRYCCKLLKNLPMSRESALLYLDLPSSIVMAEAAQALTEAARLYLAETYKDITKFQDEVLSLPLAGIESVLSSDDLQVVSEDFVFDFVLKWAHTHCPKPCFPHSFSLHDQPKSYDEGFGLQ